MRDDFIYHVSISAIIFNEYSYNELYIPLSHINFDDDGNSRSSFSLDEIVDLVRAQLNNLFLEPDGIRGKEHFYVYKFQSLNRPFKMVFSTTEKRRTLRVITLYRVRKL